MRRRVTRTLGLACSLVALVTVDCASRANGSQCHLANSTNAPPSRRFDIDCDGFADTVAVAFPVVRVFRGGPNGLGTTEAQTIMAPMVDLGSTFAAPLADVNGDGFADLVLVHAPDGSRTDGQFLEYFGGDRGLSEQPVIVHTRDIVDRVHIVGDRMAVADFNSDRIADLAIQTLDAFHMEVFLGSPGGLSGDPWATVDRQNGGEHGPLWSIAGAGDFDADGYADVLLTAAGEFGSHFTVFRGTPHGFDESVSASITPSLAHGRIAWVPGDVNGDHYADVIAMNATHPTLDVFFGGAGGVAASASQTISPAAGEAFFGVIGSGDLNGDGMDDALAVIVASDSSRRIVMLTGSLHGPALATYWSLWDPVATNGVGIDARDFDSDGFGDTVLEWRTLDSSLNWVFHATVVRGGAVSPSTPDAPFILQSGDLE